MHCFWIVIIVTGLQSHLFYGAQNTERHKLPELSEEQKEITQRLNGLFSIPSISPQVLAQIRSLQTLLDEKAAPATPLSAAQP